MTLPRTIEEFELMERRDAMERARELAADGLPREAIRARMASMAPPELLPSRKNLDKALQRAAVAAGACRKATHPVVRDDGVRYGSIAEAARDMGVAAGNVSRSVAVGFAVRGHTFRTDNKAEG